MWLFKVWQLEILVLPLILPSFDQVTSKKSLRRPCSTYPAHCSWNFLSVADTDQRLLFVVTFCFQACRMLQLKVFKWFRMKTKTGKIFDHVAQFFPYELPLHFSSSEDIYNSAFHATSCRLISFTLIFHNQNTAFPSVLKVKKRSIDC